MPQAIALEPLQGHRLDDFTPVRRILKSVRGDNAATRANDKAVPVSRQTTARVERRAQLIDDSAPRAAAPHEPLRRPDSYSCWTVRDQLTPEPLTRRLSIRPTPDRLKGAPRRAAMDSVHP
jgi:hypothetical protein